MGREFFLTADKIHNGHQWLPVGTVLAVAADGTILSVQQVPHPDAVHYDGVLTPGFVNVHCHLELSHMKGMVPEHTGLIPFLKTIPKHRNDYTDEQKKAARMAGHNELLQNGIVAVGDIANTTDTLDTRALDQLHYQTFVESIGFTEANAVRAFGFATQTYDAFAAQAGTTKKLQQAIIPHAPYSVSSALFRLIDAHKPGVISIHNQESREEDKYYLRKEGDVRDLLHTLGIDDTLFSPTGRTSLQSYLDLFSPEHPFIFVHNTYTSRDDVQYAHHKLKQAYWCLCPNANLYIENALPDIDMLVSEHARVCVGTDSLASNHQLSVLAELQSIKQYYPHLSWETLLMWGTSNGASALHMADVIGTIEPGKRPGILHISNLETTTQAIINRII